MRPALLAWCQADPVDSAERARSSRIAGWQGTQNPFVVDATLASRAFATTTATEAIAQRPTLALSLLSPNPAGPGLVRATLSLARPEHVRASVYDALGREVLAVHDGLAAGVLAISVDVSRLTPGVYVLRAASTDGFAAPAARRFVVVF